MIGQWRVNLLNYINSFLIMHQSRLKIVEISINYSYVVLQLFHNLFIMEEIFRFHKGKTLLIENQRNSVIRQFPLSIF